MGSEVACVYAALILHDDGLEVSADNISSILKAAGVEIEPYWPTLFAKLCKGKDIGAMLSSVGTALAQAAAARWHAGRRGGLRRWCYDASRYQFPLPECL